MLNVKVEASVVNSVNSTQIKPVAISVRKDILKVVSKMLNNFVIMLIFNCYCLLKATNGHRYNARLIAKYRLYILMEHRKT